MQYIYEKSQFNSLVFTRTPFKVSSIKRHCIVYSWLLLPTEICCAALRLRIHVYYLSAYNQIG